MKLFNRYSFINLLASIAIFVVASVAFYFSLRFVLINQIDQDLKIEEDEITAFVQKYKRLPESFSVSDQVILFLQTGTLSKRGFTTLEMTDGGKKINENYRRLSFGIRVDEKLYEAQVSKSLKGTDNLLKSILWVSVSTILLILVVAAVINRFLLKNLWKPFYQSINALKNFRISNEQPLSLPATDIDEFALLNKALKGITYNARLEYLALKTFSENASHEFQTPIAIIRSKLDLLIQDEQLSLHQADALQSAFNAIEKLSRLNQSLLLLAKIENNQYEEVEVVDLKQEIEQKVQDFHELWQSQSMQIHTSLGDVSIKMNKELLDILLNNLVSNATHHNYTGGSVSISLSANCLVISNTSRTPALEEKKLFQRFYKPGQGSSHNGLGLSLIKQIADVSDFGLNYIYTRNEHSFTIDWTKSSLAKGGVS
ncbi:MAG TPA: HAMP domain-containing sensor histidine kinase [Flavitalea sp.]|nr:HAMP domain-containing sensor histidine kinase [Flavitalea sp.]